MKRRRFLISGAGTAAAIIVPLTWVPARATPDSVRAAMRDVLGDTVPKPGRVKLEIPALVENGNAVAMTVSCDALPGEVRSIHVFADGNLLPNVIHARFGPRAGRARLSTRIRLTASQTVIAVAMLSDGSCWLDSVELMVTLAACLD